jgi:8-oxo-dGTP diphosphatase
VSDVVKAAGGVVWRMRAADHGNDVVPEGAGGRGDRREVVLVHRPKYDDWTLPKGKLLPGEDDRTAALREVEEETGFRCEIDRPLGSIEYRDQAGRPKTVAYFLMRPLSGVFTPTDEVDELLWLPKGEAAGHLTYAHDRDLLHAVDGERNA